MIPVAEARRRILSSLQPMPGETVALPLASGRVLARPLVARVSQPPASVSAMDGYAVRADDVARSPAELDVVAVVPAGHPHGGTLSPGEAARIFTGAVLPSGTDTVIIQEHTEPVGESRVRVLKGSPAGRHVRSEGLDFREGSELLPAGTLLTARALGLAAAGNHPWVHVHRRPSVALLGTGREVVLPGEPRAAGQIVSSNALALAALVEASGGVSFDVGPIDDDPASLASALDAVQGADLLVTTGGVSVGDHDLVRPGLEARGLRLDFWKIAMQPGKPLLFGSFPEGPSVLGLPGNPVSAVVCARVFLYPALRKMTGNPVTEDETCRGVLGCSLPANGERENYLRARLSTDEVGRTIATPYALQDSSVLSVLARSDCLVIRPPRAPAAEAGDAVSLLPFPSAAGGF